ncbi:iron response transcriptional regulator IrrA [Pseudaminobacter soli (ex Li et al. 2025)]|uniref:Ferric uptake regulation protein n=1 Tax=Pseudaminobacter soli (ex Li et al. 2025) TaxID=1295366 RepID=A0A2P7SIE9_9HYPH|nr:Fur family transcriptional regulator [Mesorhizobium soli]PSJ62125.1 transcriptional repressor [Mesorhizobium soli]
MLLVPEETRKRLLAERALPRASEPEVEQRLKDAGLRPTRQRVAIGRLLFGSAHRHVTADDLLQEANFAGEMLSLATIYNTLGHFSEAGLIRRISVDDERAHFDTDTGNHHHFYIEAEGLVLDVAPGGIAVERLPTPPEGYEITRVDVVVRLTQVQPEPPAGQAMPDSGPRSLR